MQAEIAEQPLRGLGGNRDAVHAVQPDSRSVRAETVLEPRLLHKRNEFWRHSPPAALQISREEARQALGVTAVAPFANRRATQGEMARLTGIILFGKGVRS